MHSYGNGNGNDNSQTKSHGAGKDDKAVKKPVNGNKVGMTSG